MKRMLNGLSLVALMLMVGLSLVACSTDVDSPTGVVDPALAGNFYNVGGRVGELAIRVQAGEIALNLPAGIWKVTYTVNGVAYEVAVYLENEGLIFIGILDHGLATDVVIQQGATALTGLKDGDQFTVADWTPAPDQLPIQLVANGEMLVTELDKDVAHPKPEPVVAATGATVKTYRWNGASLDLVSEMPIAGPGCAVKVINNEGPLMFKAEMLGEWFEVGGDFQYIAPLSAYTWNNLDCPAPVPTRD